METFVTYEQAVKLRECGFNGLTNSFYDECSGHQGEFEIVPTYAKFNEVGRTPGCECVSAPLLSQAQKWLREVKGFHCQVLLNGVRSAYFWQVRERVGNGLYADSTHQYEMFEDAITDCITAALELIEKKGKYV